MFFGQDWENLFEPRAREFDIGFDVSAAMAIAGLEDFGDDGLDLLNLGIGEIELTGEVPRHELLRLLVAPALAQGNDAHDEDKKRDRPAEEPRTEDSGDTATGFEFRFRDHGVQMPRGKRSIQWETSPLTPSGRVF